MAASRGRSDPNINSNGETGTALYDKTLFLFNFMGLLTTMVVHPDALPDQESASMTLRLTLSWL